MEQDNLGRLLRYSKFWWHVPCRWWSINAAGFLAAPAAAVGEGLSRPWSWVRGIVAAAFCPTQLVLW